MVFKFNPVYTTIPFIHILCIRQIFPETATSDLYTLWHHEGCWQPGTSARRWILAESLRTQCVWPRPPPDGEAPVVGRCLLAAHPRRRRRSGSRPRAGPGPVQPATVWNMKGLFKADEARFPTKKGPLGERTDTQSLHNRLINNQRGGWVLVTFACRLIVPRAHRFPTKSICDGNQQGCMAFTSLGYIKLIYSEVHSTH